MNNLPKSLLILFESQFQYLGIGKDKQIVLFYETTKNHPSPHYYDYEFHNISDDDTHRSETQIG